MPPRLRFYISLLGIPLAILASKHLIDSIAPVMQPIQQLCANPDKAHGLGVRTVFSGVQAVDQGFLCFIVPFFMEAISTSIGRVITAELLGLFAVVLVMFTMEGSRTRTMGTLLSWSSVIGFLCNIISVSVTVPLVWVPAYEWYANGQPSGKRNVILETISPGRAAAIMISVLLVFGGPSVSMFLNLEKSTLEYIIAVWQFVPLLVGPIAIALTPLFGWVALPTPQTSGDDKLFKARWRVIQSKSMVETVYLLFMGLGALLHYGVIIHSAWTGVGLIQGVYDIATYQTNAVLTAPENLPSTVYAYFLLGDWFVLALSLASFALFEDGIMGLLVYLIITACLGPASGLAGYLAWRENGVQNSKLVVEKTE
ncbi:hypothetical protein INT43_002370 [Umbelopsis isabellina]|uniref:Uncharacterized protein n=1 Tax=Mortierella isabellina TaxID=91625 RepID=A0A8H7ULA1_MORIS|nr:hypothetical protein INT43_002370 [Umbelopsis isabellina]